MKRFHRRNLKDRFEIIKTLGQGTYGKVKLAVEKSTGKKYAIKSIRWKRVHSEQDILRIKREIEIMGKLSHPNITSVYEIYENAEKIILVMEYSSGGELYDYINEKKGLSEEEARHIFRQIVSAVHYLHMNGIVHRDLKLENILLNGNNFIKIADFGLANLYDNNALLNTYCGSPLYASPEIVNGFPYHGPEVDCWSLGVLLYTLVYGSMPFDGSNFRRLRQQITEGEYFEPDTPSDAAGLIRHLLTPTPSKRATIDDICGHWWVNFCHKDSPAEENLARQRIDIEQIQNRLSGACSSDSEDDNSVSSESSVKESQSTSSPPIKGILKKPKETFSADSKSEDEAVILDADWSACNSGADWSNEYDENTKNQEEQSSVICVNNSISPTSPPVFDSSRKPKRSILKKNRYSGADSGCIMDETISALIPSLALETSQANTAIHDINDNLKPVSKSTPSNTLTQSMCNLTDIGNTPDTIESSQVLANLEPKLSAHNRSVSCSGNMDADLSVLFEGVVLRKKKPTSCRPLKGILKRGSKYSPGDNESSSSWRYSVGSQGSNSSGDILDFSYDSMDCESFLVDISLPEPPKEVKNDSKCKVDGTESEEDYGPPPPLPTTPPPSYHTMPIKALDFDPLDEINSIGTGDKTSHRYGISFEGTDIVEKIALMEKCNEKKEKCIESAYTYEEVDDIVLRALEIASKAS